MNVDKFNLWRAIFSLVHLDKHVSTEEENWINNKLKTLSFTEDQQNILREDIIAKKDIFSFLDLITNKADRAFLLHQVRVVSNIDGDYSEDEKVFFKELEAKIIGKLDLEPIVQEIEQMEQEEYRVDEVYSVDNEHSFFEKMYKGFLRLMNSDNYKFPK